MSLRALAHNSTLQKIGRELTPDAVSEIRKYKSETEGMRAEQKREARASLGRRLWWSAFRVGASAAIYQATAATVGVSARDTELSFSAEKAWGNTSSLSLTIAGSVAAAIPPTWREAIANIIIPVEVCVSVIRMYVEQRLWKKYKITPDPAGTLLTPYLAGALELGYKAITVYPQDAGSRLMVGLVGIWGNLVRMATAGVMYFIGKSVEDKPEEKPANPNPSQA